MNTVLLLLAGVATFLMGCLAAYYKRLSDREGSQNAKLKDSLELTDTRTRLRDQETNIKQLEKERLDAKRNYDNRPWRPTDSK